MRTRKITKQQGPRTWLRINFDAMTNASTRKHQLRKLRSKLYRTPSSALPVHANVYVYVHGYADVNVCFVGVGACVCICVVCTYVYVHMCMYISICT